MQLDAVKLFCEVAQHRSISRAAEAHGVTQSAASQRIQALEKELDVQLVDRSTRPLSLTSAGEVYYRGCRRILNSYESLKRRILERREAVRGGVGVAAIYSAGIDLLNQVAEGFEREYPHSHISVTYHQPDAVYDSVRDEHCDLGILSYPRKWSGVAALPLREETMSLVVGLRHSLSHRDRIDAAELADYDLVGFDSELPIGRDVRKYLSRECAEARIVNHFDNIDTIKTFVAQSNLAAILPFRTVQREVASGTLTAITLTPRLTRPLGIVYLKQRPQRPVVRAFIEYLLKHQPLEATEPLETKAEVSAA